MKILFLGTGYNPFVMEVEDELQNLQSLVGGRIEVMSIHTKDNRSIDFIFNDLKHLIRWYFSRMVYLMQLWVIFLLLLQMSQQVNLHH